MRYEFVVNVFVFNKDGTSLAFVKRTKKPFVGFYLPPGGHIEEGEHPIKAAVREVKEETGFDVEIIDFRPGIPIVLDATTIRIPSPLHVQIEYIDQNHRHVDFIFVAEVVGEDSISDEFKDRVKWFHFNEIKGKKMPKNVKDVANFLFRWRRGE